MVQDAQDRVHRKTLEYRDPTVTYSTAYVSLAKLQRVIQEYRFGLGALLIPLGIRAIPEKIAEPYPVGFDITASCVPNTLDWPVCPGDRAVRGHIRKV